MQEFHWHAICPSSFGPDGTDVGADVTDMDAAGLGATDIFATDDDNCCWLGEGGTEDDGWRWFETNVSRMDGTDSIVAICWWNTGDAS